MKVINDIPKGLLFIWKDKEWTVCETIASRDCTGEWSFFVRVAPLLGGAFLGDEKDISLEQFTKLIDKVGEKS